MRRRAEASQSDGFEAFARALQSTFPARNDAPLALTLLGLLSEGRPVTAAALAQTAMRQEGEVVGRVSSSPNVERDPTRRVVGFSGLTLRPTPHQLTVGNRQLHAWWAWDTLFLPALLGETAHVRSSCPVTDSPVELVVAPEGVTSAHPDDLHVSFPPLAGTDTADITGSFCSRVFFLAGSDAARRWRQTGAEDSVFDVHTAYELGRRAVMTLLEPASPTVMEVSH